MARMAADGWASTSRFDSAQFDGMGADAPVFSPMPPSTLVVDRGRVSLKKDCDIFKPNRLYK